MYALLIDAMSAFDKIVRQCAVRSAYLAGTCDQGLLYLDSRLASRSTYTEWDKVIMGPIRDSLGLEQGGYNSGDLYKLNNNNQLTTAQLSQLGVPVGPVVVSSVGQADDVLLSSDCIFKLLSLVYLTENYCQEYHVTLVPEKTKLMVFSPPGQEDIVNLAKAVNPITVAGLPIQFTDSAEHVGILRTTEGGNMPHILGRISAHRGAVAGVLHTGLAKGHRGNPVAGLRVHRVYGASRLMSGVNTLVLSSPELGVLHHHYKVSIRQILRLSDKTPECFVMLMAGTLPATALLHLAILSLVGMIARRGPDCILNKIGRAALQGGSGSQSWFNQARHITQKYGLPDPLLVLQQPTTKGRWKSTCRSKVLDCWESQYRGEAVHLDSLLHFKSNYFSLSKPPRILATAQSPYEVSRALTAVRMMSGRYVSDHRTRHWDGANPEGLCRLCPPSQGQPAPQGDLAHQLLLCQGLQEARHRAVQLWAAHMADRPHLLPVVSYYSLGTREDSLSFLLNPSSCPLVIGAAQQHGPSVYDDCHFMARVWCHSIHSLRIKLLKLNGFI